jgi:hypothetical protein
MINRLPVPLWHSIHLMHNSQMLFILTELGIQVPSPAMRGALRKG